MQFDDDRKAAIRDQVRRIAATEPFARATKTNNLLAFIVDMTLEGRPEELNQRRIAEMVFGKKDFDPTIDGFVKERARDLRKKLETYYAGEGRNDQWKIDIPNGGFVAKFTLQQPLEQAAGDHAPYGNILGRMWRWVVRRRWPVPVGVAAVVIFLVVEVFASPGRPVKIKNLADGAKVHAQHAQEDIVVTGCEAGRKCYLVVAPLDGWHREWIQGSIKDQDTSVDVTFGDAKTPAGMKFHVYVLSTKSDLGIGELGKEPEDPRKLGMITVTLEK